MKFLDYLRLAWDQLRRRKVVTLLCMMGIGIGSSSIIVALSFSESVTQFSEQRLGFYLKTDEIEVFAGRGGDVSNPLIANDTYALTEQKIKVIQQLPHVVGTAHFQEFGYHSFIVDQTKQGSAEVIATDFEALEQFGYELQQGSFDHVHNGIILSYGATMNLRDTRLPVILKQSANTEEQPIFAYPMYQKMITLEVNSRDDGGNIVEHQIPLRVVGILKRPEGMPDDLVQHNNMAFVTQETADRIMDVLESERVSDVTLKIKVDSVENVKETETLVQKLKLSTMSNLVSIGIDAARICNFATFTWRHWWIYFVCGFYFYHCSYDDVYLSKKKTNRNYESIRLQFSANPQYVHR